MANWFGEDEEELEVPGAVPPSMPSAAPAQMNPQVKDYLMEKFQLGTGDRISAALGAIGAGFQGKDSMAAGQNILQNARKNKMQDYELEKMAKLDSEENDPRSDSSKIAQQLAGSMGFKGDISKLTAAKMKNFSPAMAQIYKLEQQKEMARILAKEKRELEKSKKTEGMTEGRKAVDKDFAKDYTEWNTVGRPAAEKNLERLTGALNKLGGDGISGRILGRLPEALRPEESLVVQQDVQAAAQGALKAALGAQFTEREGERIMKAAFDPKLSEGENKKKIEAAIREIQGHVKNKDSMSKYFEGKGTLTGFEPSRESLAGGGSGKTKIVNGKTYKQVPGGWEEVPTFGQR